VKDGEVVRSSWTAESLGLPECRVADLQVNSPEESAAVIESILKGEKGPRRDIVVANVAAALLAAEKTDDLQQGVRLACEAIDNGRAAEVLGHLVEVSNRD
jgi:anthranilate phosphoribosyltransferase